MDERTPETKKPLGFPRGSIPCLLWAHQVSNLGPPPCESDRPLITSSG